MNRFIPTIEFYRRLTLGSSPLVAHKQVQLWLRTVTYNELVRWYLDRAQDLEATPNTYGERLETLANQMRQQGEAATTKEPPFAHPQYWAAFVLVGHPF